jgi:four helix bundle protein
MKYSELLVWQKAMDLVEQIYRATRSFPTDERFGLASQTQRAAVSIPSNIAEGHGRKSTGAYLNHLSVATGSLMEVETQVQIAQRLGFLTAAECCSILATTDEISRMLSGLRASLNPRSSILDPRS